MGVFANGLEISSQGGECCKVIAAFPDTCFTPPQNPATPPGVAGALSQLRDGQSDT